MTTIYLVRHGETDENAAHILQGQLPGHLSLLGKEQIETLSKHLEQIQFNALICSDLQRCIDTANMLNETRRLPLHITNLLRERDWGSFTGKCIYDVQHMPMPDDVESIEAMRDRAEEFLDFVRTRFTNQRVLAVGHGLINRAILAVHYGKKMNEIEKMGNAMYRILEL